MLSTLLEDHSNRRELERQEAEAARTARMWDILRQAVIDADVVSGDDLDALASWVETSRIDVDFLEGAILHSLRLQEDCRDIVALRRKMSVIAIKPNACDREETEAAWARAYESFLDWQNLHRQLPSLIPSPPRLPELLEV